MTDYRTERDSIGQVNVPRQKYWGAQTQRSLENFKIGSDKIPIFFIKAFAMQKKAAAISNIALEKLDNKFPVKKRLIVFGQGSGHGVGMSQWGAKYMASKGIKAEKILKHYYRGVQIKPFRKDFL